MPLLPVGVAINGESDPTAAAAADSVRVAPLESTCVRETAEEASVSSSEQFLTASATSGTRSRLPVVVLARVTPSNGDGCSGMLAADAVESCLITEVAESTDIGRPEVTEEQV